MVLKRVRGRLIVQRVMARERDNECLLQPGQLVTLFRARCSNGVQPL
jgi:hypothetical protein